MNAAVVVRGCAVSILLVVLYVHLVLVFYATQHDAEYALLGAVEVVRSVTPRFLSAGLSAKAGALQDSLQGRYLSSQQRTTPRSVPTIDWAEWRQGPRPLRMETLVIVVFFNGMTPRALAAPQPARP
jgi:hypothetical protein